MLTLKGHKERVNGVRWLTKDLLVSVSADKSFIIWGYDGKEFRVVQHNKDAHPEAINYLSVLNVDEKEVYFLSMCLGGTLKMWIKSGEIFEQKGEILFGKNL